ncbi:MAG: DUF58 domain-containing protein [Bacteroidetes bacterium]|nr:MAG: DUF58 domain-containing protein [Bacteroidota bacterium]
MENTLKKEASYFASIEFLAKQVVQGFITGLHKSPFHGFSVEFAEHRLYNTGESTRHIDWKVFAKTDKVFNKRFVEETNLRCHILLDTSGSMYYPEGKESKINFATLAAGAIIQMLQKQRDAVKLTTFSDKIDYQSQMKSTSTHSHDLFTILDQVKSKKTNAPKTGLLSTLHQMAETIHRRSLVVILSDFYEDLNEIDKLFDAFKHLKHNKHEILIFHIRDKKTEDLFQFADKPTIFIDNETGEKIKLNPSLIRENYLTQISSFNAALKLKCRQYKMDFIDVDSALDLKQILLPFLIKRTKMK